MGNSCCLNTSDVSNTSYAYNAIQVIIPLNIRNDLIGKFYVSKEKEEEHDCKSSHEGIVCVKHSEMPFFNYRINDDAYVTACFQKEHPNEECVLVRGLVENLQPVYYPCIVLDSRGVIKDIYCSSNENIETVRRNDTLPDNCSKNFR